MQCLDIAIRQDENKGSIMSATTDVRRALDNYYKTHKKDVPINVRNMLADLLCEGAGDDVLAETSALVAKNRAALSALKGETRRYTEYRTKAERDREYHIEQLNRLAEEGECKVEALKMALVDLTEKIEALDGTTIANTETDPALAGAKRAYDWIYGKTKDEKLSARAFNSYLIGGQYRSGDVYKEEPTVINAQTIIKDAYEHSERIQEERDIF